MHCPRRLQNSKTPKLSGAETTDAGLRTLSWNSLRQLVSVSTNGVPAESYTYDALGRRATTTTAEGSVRHVYDGIHCIADTDESGAILRTYVWGLGIDNLLAVVVPSGGGASPPGEPCVYYALTDHQNTVHGFADTNGSVVVRYAYDAWGNLLSEECSVPALASNRYRFQGREWSAATGLYNFRARWYAPETGRCLSKDPIGLAGGLNLYAFCRNEPADCLDPNGTDIYLVAGGPNDKIPIHQKIVVTYVDPDTCEECEYASSFGLKNRVGFLKTFFPWSPTGQIYKDEPTGPRLQRVSLTNDQSFAVYRKLREIEGMNIHYNIRSQCRHYSQIMVEGIAEHYGATIENLPGTTALSRGEYDGVAVAACGIYCIVRSPPLLAIGSTIGAGPLLSSEVSEK